MHVAGKHDLGGAQPPVWRGHPFPNPFRIDRERRGCFENAGSRSFGGRSKSKRVIEWVEVKRGWEMDRVEIVVGPQMRPDPIGGPALDVNSDVLAEEAKEPHIVLRGIGVGDLEPAALNLRDAG